MLNNNIYSVGHVVYGRLTVTLLKLYFSKNMILNAKKFQDL